MFIHCWRKGRSSSKDRDISSRRFPLTPFLGFWETARYRAARSTHKARVGSFENWSRQCTENALRRWQCVARGRNGLTADNIHLRRRYPRCKQVYAATDVLWHPKRRCQSIDGAGRVSQDGKFIDFQGLAYSINIIYRKLAAVPGGIFLEHTRPTQWCRGAIVVRLTLSNTRPIWRNQSQFQG